MTLSSYASVNVSSAESLSVFRIKAFVTTRFNVIRFCYFRRLSISFVIFSKVRLYSYGNYS